MSSELQARELDHDRRNRQQHRRMGVPMRAVRLLGVLAAGAAVAVLAAGGVSADTGIRLEKATGAGCSEPAAGQPNGKQWQAEPGMVIDTSAGYTATLETTCGTVTIALEAAQAPRTVNSFAFLSGEQYFDHTKCHRLTTQGIYVLQCGDPTASGMGGPGYKFPDENLAGATYPAGTVAMANAGPGTNGSQFFLVYQDTRLPANYTPFGRIIGGMDVLGTIAAAGVQDGSGDGAPATDMILDSVTTVRN
ncbi:peptidylprolyl isomerase [Nocardia sp. NBC_01009]|uniref:peptidylprolyl isomerase n=1 Tax=Nocardia sp. NBC_01009 TaxID=2975996 RepID=UPI00386BBA3F|nr:peptidylprolyl isomerase [Nocardia sp. NBC_01009]